MKSPFRKLIRISVVLFVLVLLFNFFGYYCNNIRSIENKELIEAVNRSGHQQTLCQQIAKESMLLLSDTESIKRDALKGTLGRRLLLYKNEQEFLQRQAGATPPPVPERIFQIKLLLSSSRQFFLPMIDIGEGITQADSSLLAMNKTLYLRELMYNEQKFSSLMDQVTQTYAEMVNEKSREGSTLNTGKFNSMIISILCLIWLVLEPAFKKGETNYKELQKAKNELLNEKKFLASILQSQTNYVIRINRTGHF